MKYCLGVACRLPSSATALFHNTFNTWFWLLFYKQSDSTHRTCLQSAHHLSKYFSPDSSSIYRKILFSWKPSLLLLSSSFIHGLSPRIVITSHLADSNAKLPPAYVVCLRVVWVLFLFWETTVRVKVLVCVHTFTKKRNVFKVLLVHLLSTEIISICF